MRKVAVENLQAGMIVARPIYTDAGIVLLNADTKLNESYIRKIAGNQLAFIYIEDDLSKGILSTEIISDETRIETKKLLNKSLTKFKDGHLKGNQKLIESIEHIIDDVLLNKQVMVSLHEMRNKDDYLQMHAINVCVVSCIMGKKLEFTEKQMKLLAMGALLHDVGKVQINFDCTRYRDDYVETEFELYKRHTKVGNDMILSMPDINSVVASVARQHHENYDGSGFPKGIQGEAINELSRIVAIANEYDNLLYNMPPGEELKHYEIIEIITAKAFSVFDPSLIRIFRSSISPYPIGSGVLLNDGRVGIVSKINEAFPTRPVIRIIDPVKKIVIEEVDLSRSISVMIAEEKDIDK